MGNQWAYTIDIPVSGTPFQYISEADAVPSLYIRVPESSLKLSTDDVTYILKDDIITIMKTYGWTALFTMGLGVTTNFIHAIYAGSAAMLGKLTALPMLAGYVGERSWNMPWNWWADRGVADATRIAGGAVGGLMTRFGQTAFGATHLGGAYALPAVALATMLVYNYDLWPATMSIAWETASGAPTQAYKALKAALTEGSKLPVEMGRVVGETLGAGIGGLGGAIPEGIADVFSSATLTIALVVGSLLGLAVLQAAKA